MSATRDPDRLLRAWLDLMPEEAPDRAIAAVLQATAKAPQARALPWHGRRRFQMNRLTLIAAVAALLAALVGGAMLLSSGRGPTAAVPTPTPLPTAPPLPTATPSPTREPIVAPLQTTWGDWIADVPAIPEIGIPAGMLQLSVDWEKGNRVWVQTTPDYRQILASSPLAAPAGELRLRSNTVENVYCPNDSEGRYGWSRSADGLFMTLTLIEDACPARSAALARTWVHSLGAVNDGGPGVIYGMDPDIQLSMTRGQRYGLGGGDHAAALTTFGDVEPFRAFVAVKNPGGFGAPCASGDAKKIDIPHTTGDFTSYVNELPGATVVTRDVTIGGRPGTQLDVSIDPNVSCNLTDGIKAFHPELKSDQAMWPFNPGEVETLYILQMDADNTLLLWYQGTADEETALLDSIQFIDKLPTP